jgi:hypothetical protein
VLGEAGFRSLRIDRDDGRSSRRAARVREQRDPARPLLGVWELEGTHFLFAPGTEPAWAPASSYALSRHDPRRWPTPTTTPLLAADRRLGELFDWLDASGRAERTLGS